MIRATWLLLALSCCVASATASEALKVYTTFYPTTWMAERIGGDLVDVVCPVPDDADPIFWRPRRDDMRGLLGADLIVINGARFEKWVLTADLPRRSVVDTARPFREQWIEFEEAVTHSHGEGGEHTHKGIDGHTWLDPILAIRQAETIRDAVARRRPDDVETIEDRFVQVRTSLEELDARLRKLGSLPEGEALVASHPAYNYLARRYGWDVVNLDLDPSRVPDDDAIAAAAETLRESGRRARVLLWESAPTAEAIEAVERELGLRSVVFSPCEMLDEARRRDGEDYVSVMRANIERAAVAFPKRES